MSINPDKGLARGLTNYGDRDFSIYLRRSFALSMGYSKELSDCGIRVSIGFSTVNEDLERFVEVWSSQLKEWQRKAA